MNFVKETVILAIIVLTAFLSMIYITINAVKKEKPNMYRVELYDDQTKVTLWCDVDGVVRIAENKRKKWMDRVLINIGKINAGDTVQSYDLLSDVIMPEEYKVLSISKN